MMPSISRRRASRWTVLALIGACAFASRISVVSSARVDRVGVKDAFIERLGDVVAIAAVDSDDDDATTGDETVVMTTEDAIARVELKSGRVAWRATHEREMDGLATRATTTTGKTTVTMSGTSSRGVGRTTRAYDVESGNVLWEDASHERGMFRGGDGEREPRRDDAADAAVSESKDETTTLAGGEVVRRATSSGEVVWRARVYDAIPGADVRWERVVRDGGKTYALGRARGGGTPCASAMDDEDGTIVRAKCASNGGRLGVVNGAFVVSRDASGRVRAHATTEDGRLATMDVDALTRGKGASVAAFPGASGKATLEPAAAHDSRSRDAVMRAGVSVVRFNDGACALARVDAESGAPRVVAAFADEPCPTFTSVVATRDGEMHVGIVRSKSDGRGAMTYETSTMNIETGETRALGETRRGDAAIRVSALRRAFLIPRARDAPFVVTVDDDATMSAHAGDDIAWTRQEASSRATAAMFGDLPATRAADVETTTRRAFSTHDASRMQLLALKAKFQLASPEEIAYLAHLRSKDATKLSPTRDVNGFRKSILTLSPRGALVALHNGDGRELWRRFFGSMTDASTTFTGLRAWIPARGDPETSYALVVAKSSSSTALFVVNQFTGDLFGEKTTVPFGAAHVLPFTTAEGADAVLIVASNGTARAFPSESTPDAFTRLRRLSYYAVDQTANEVRGYALRRTDDDGIDSVHSWTVSFPPEAGSIVGFASKPNEDERVNSWTRVPGDRSTLFKYLNPNTVFLATSDGKHVQATLIDGVTGRILYRVRHGDARGPVRAVVCENWVTYHYFNTRARRFAVSALEIFDDGDDRRNLAVGGLVYDSMLGRASNETSSSLSPPPLRIIGQSYFIRPEAKALAATRSMRGITEPAVLIATADDQVVAIDKRFLDPRRPTKPTAADREEGLIRYSEVIPILPSNWVTQHRVVHDIRGLVTAPAELESNIHFLAFGLDLFYARITPSQSFDALDDDFNYVLLSLTLVALVAAVVVARRVADANELHHAWR